MEGVGVGEADGGGGGAVGFDSKLRVCWQVVELEDAVRFAVIGGVAARMKR